MWKKLVSWFSALWNDKADPYIEAMYWDEYGYLRNKYGIAQPFADEDEEDKCRK